MRDVSIPILFQIIGEKDVQIHLLNKQIEHLQQKLTELALENGKLREEANATKDVHG